MKEEPKLVSPAGVGAAIVALLSFVPATACSFVYIFYIGEPDRKFGRSMLFELSVYVYFWMTICHLVAHFCTVFLYGRLGLPRTLKRVALHFTVATTLALGSVFAELPGFVLDSLPDIGLRLSTKGEIASLFVVVAFFALAPFAITILLHAAIYHFRKGAKGRIIATPDSA